MSTTIHSPDVTQTVVGVLTDSTPRATLGLTIQVVQALREKHENLQGAPSVETVLNDNEVRSVLLRSSDGHRAIVARNQDGVWERDERPTLGDTVSAIGFR